MFTNWAPDGGADPHGPPVDETSFVGCYVAIAVVVGIFLGGFLGFGVAFGAFYAPGLVGLVLRLATIALTVLVFVGVRHLLAKGPSHMSDPERHARMMRTHQAMQGISSIMPATGLSFDHMMFFFRVKSLTGPNISIRYYVLLWWGILFIASVIPGALTGALVRANFAPSPAQMRAENIVATAATDETKADYYFAVVQPTLAGHYVSTTYTDYPPTPSTAKLRVWVAKHRTQIVCGTEAEFDTSNSDEPSVFLTTDVYARAVAYVNAWRASVHCQNPNEAPFAAYWAARPPEPGSRRWLASYYWVVVRPTFAGQHPNLFLSGYPPTPSTATLRAWVAKNHKGIVCGTAAPFALMYPGPYPHPAWLAKQGTVRC